MTIEGVDYAWNGPSVAALKAAGKRFVVRYGGPGSDGKQLHAAELRDLRAAGIEVVANAEGGAGAFRTRAAGRAWAADAKTHFGSLGMPAGRPVYFSADWDVQPSEYAAVDEALRGAAEVIGAGAVGLYGSYRIIEHCKKAGTARWFWQTYAWSGGKQPEAGTHLYQYRNGVDVGGADCDLDRALVDDYGQWGWKPPASQGEDDMAIDDTDIARIWAFKANVNPGGDANWQRAIDVLGWCSLEHHRQIDALNRQADALNQALAGITRLLTGSGQVDAQALAAFLAPAVAAAVLSALPADGAESGSTMSAADLDTMIRAGVARALVGAAQALDAA